MVSMTSVTISAKIPATLKRKLERYKIRVSDVVRAALEREVLRAEESALTARLDLVSSRLAGKLTPEDIVSAVRAGREEG